MVKKMNFFKLWAPVILWMGVIFFFSSIPHLKSGFKYDFILRKIAHVTEYFILTFFLFRAFKESFDIRIFYFFISPALASFFYAISDEIHQSFVPGRTCAVRDVFIDSLGVVIFYFIIRRLTVKQRANA
jgi:VanZ family protein